MIWTWVLTNPAERDLRRLGHDDRRRILDALDRFIEDPAQGDVRKLQAREDEWRLRVGDWRVRFRKSTRIIRGSAFERHEGIILVTRVLHRREAYRD